MREERGFKCKKQHVEISTDRSVHILQTGISVVG